MPPSAQISLIETLVELHFTGSRWDETMPGRFCDRVQALGFAHHLPRSISSLVRDEAPRDARYGALTAPSAPLSCFHREHDHAALQLERDLLVVNQLAPVPTLDRWLPTIEAAARVYADLAAPRGCPELRLRTIHRLELPTHELSLRDYVQIGPAFPAAWNESQDAFALRIERRMAHDLAILLTFGSSASPSPDHASFVLDLCAIHLAEHSLAPTDLARPLQSAHAALETALENSLTPQLRAFLTPEHRP
ncbi:MAG: hypothetical protein JNM84_25230 [Planctomycetes bacterium]|nr:hypothetical protein [Planctomycetota bacterium]